MKIQEIMTPSVDLTDPNTTIRDAAIRMRDGDLGALPVGENDRLVGMVTDRDIAVRGVGADKAPGNCTVREVRLGTGPALLRPALRARRNRDARTRRL